MVREAIKVAIADDNRDFAEIMQECLNQQQDINLVGVAYNGEEMLTLIDDKKPDVVILDIIMPRISTASACWSA